MIFSSQEEVESAFSKLNGLEKEAVVKMANLIVKDPFATKYMKTVVAGLILFAPEYD